MPKAKIKKCPKCWGFGWWPMGDLCPIGNYDSQEFGNKVIQCPWCKKGTVTTEIHTALRQFPKHKVDVTPYITKEMIEKVKRKFFIEEEIK